MQPIQSVASIATTTNRLVSGAQSSVGTDRGEQDDEPAHRRRAPLALMARQALGADHLPHLERAQPADDRGTRRRTPAGAP